MLWLLFSSLLELAFTVTIIVCLSKWSSNCSDMDKNIEPACPNISNYSTSEDEDNPVPNECQNTPNNKLIDIPNLILKRTKMAKYYNINGSTFLDDDASSRPDDDDMIQYELHKVIKEEDDLSSDDEDSFLDIHVVSLVQGVIINSNVYLSDLQWNSISTVKGSLCRCAVCQVYCDRANVDDHVTLRSHLTNLDKYRPVRRFDLSVTREIHENYHCGVCNEIYPKNDHQRHESSKSHEGNLLTAINKVSDLPEAHNENRNVHNENRYVRNENQSDHNGFWSSDFSSNETESYHFDAQAINNPNGIIRNEKSYAQSLNRYVHYENRYGYNENNDGDRNDLQKNSSFSFNVDGINNNNINIYAEFSDDDEYDEYTTPREGISYASMASKPSVVCPKFLKIDLGTKEVRVKFESWHMIIKTELNKFYCMVCKKGDYIRFKSQHCISCEHLELLRKCSVVGAFEDYLIRQVGEQFYHCGHCNNLQYKNEIEIHIESSHPRKNKNINDTVNSPAKNALKKFNKQDKNKIEPKTRHDSDRCIEAKYRHDSDRSVETSKSKIPQAVTSYDIFGYITLNPFGCPVKITCLSYNIIMEVESNDDEVNDTVDFYCALCDQVVVKENLKDHVEGLSHIDVMRMTPFIRPFKSNLTRAVRGTLHCGLCNKQVTVASIIDHNMDSPHTTALANALGMKRSQRPADAKYKKEWVYIQDDVLSEQAKIVTNDTTNSMIDLAKGNVTPNDITKDSAADQAKKTLEEIKKTALDQQKQKTSSDMENCGQKIPVIVTRNSQPVLKISDDNNSEKSTQNGESFKNVPENTNGQSTITFSLDNLPPIPPPMQFLPGGPFFGFPPQMDPNQFLGPPLIGHFNMPMFPGYPPPFFPNQLSPDGAQLSPNGAQLSPSGVQLSHLTGTVDSKDSQSTTDKKSDSASVKSESQVKLNESQSSEEPEKEFNFDQLILLKLKTSYFKISNTSYNSLVYLDNQVRYCFVCSINVQSASLRKHVDSREHTENVDKNKFLDKYGVQLFRQMYLTYHCAVCNVLMSRKEIKIHLNWSIHIENYNSSHKASNKKNRKTELQFCYKEQIIHTQKESIFLNGTEPKVKLIDSYKIVPDSKQTGVLPLVKKDKVARKSKIIILNNNVMKINFEHWNGILSSKNGTKCIVCQTDISQESILDHVVTDYHSVALGKPFDKQYYPALVRKINESTVHCMFCNIELLYNDDMVLEHINGRKHGKNHDGVNNESSNSDSYSDCYEDILNL